MFRSTMNKQTSFTHDALAIYSLTDTCLVLGQLYTPSHAIGAAMQIESSTIFMTKMMLGDATSIECHVQCANKCTNCEHWHVGMCAKPKAYAYGKTECIARTPEEEEQTNQKFIVFL